jgi:hypothetical protein
MRRPPPRGALLLALLFAALQAALLFSTAAAKSDTFDEPTYLRAGALQWTEGRMCMTPVPAWAFGAALAATGTLGEVSADMDPEAYFIQAGMERRLLAGRAATIAVVVAAGLLLFLTGARVSARVGLLAQALWCFSPALLAHGSLATLDAWTAALLAGALWAFARFEERPTAWRAAAVGAFVALAGGAKITAVGAAPFAVLGFWLVVRGRRGVFVRAVSAFVVGFALTTWAACRFEVGIVNYERPGFRFEAGPLPAPSWLRQWVAQSHHGFVTGHLGYLDGQLSSSGWWWFYLACLALQVPIAVQALALLRPAAQQRSERARDALLLGFPLLLLVVMSAGKTQLGIRYLLPAAPFVCLSLARGAARARWYAGAATGLVALAAVSAVRNHPDHLMYFNAWAGGAAGGLDHLVQGTDWCQDKKLLAAWQRSAGVGKIRYLGCGAPAAVWGIDAGPLVCGDTEPGVYAVDAIELLRPRVPEAVCFEGLLAETPDVTLGGTIRVYHLDGARLRRVLMRWRVLKRPRARDR